MSDERDELAKVIVAAYGEDAEAECPCEQDLEVTDAILAAGYRKPRQVTTVEELDALPVRSVVLDSMEGPVVKVGGWWHSAYRRFAPDEIAFPATVLHVGDAK